MAKKQNWYYVLVMTDNGPIFVTKVNYSNKTAEWDKTGKPLEMSKVRAEDLTFGLTMNFFTAFIVCSKYELDRQPYRYEDWRIKWEELEEKEDDGNDPSDRES